MNRFRWVAFVGAGVLALTAAGMMLHDLQSVSRLASISWDHLRFPVWADRALHGAITGTCPACGLWRPRRTRDRADLVATVNCSP